MFVTEHAATPEILEKGPLALFALAPELRARPARLAMMTAPRDSCYFARAMKATPNMAKLNEVIAVET